MDILRALLQISIYSAVIFAVIMLLKKILGKRMSPALHYGVWTLLIIRLILPITFDPGISLITISEPGNPVQQQTTQDGIHAPCRYAGYPVSGRSHGH